MKNFSILLLLLISFTEVTAQKYSPILDDVPVIQDFKFGQHKPYFNDLQYSMVFEAKSNDKLDVFVYKYLGNKPNQLYGFYWDTVFLMFSRDVLIDYEISESAVVNDGVGVGISFSSENFKYAWYLNNLSDHFSNYTVQVDSADDAYKIISEFSGENIDDVKKLILKYNDFEESEPLYLHFIKSIKHI